ncbi:Adenosine 3'-phospho 5'-phosphosulfate transporter 1 [Bagarius yarrelli]|uniref:Adenosine 3'-phospho 5'-phosphosulfate transporter 1 n=1 Tax=Bagarius yarrelli TaxID=175774 RepID=A0A556TT38_BAGYA|nr:Adenosine 3'-phospho 5'-phosphosulfate transporter 1 [Bagarius yarrelli]
MERSAGDGDDKSKFDLLEDNRIDSGIDSFWSLTRDDRCSTTSSVPDHHSGGEEQDKLGTDERLDSSYGSSSLNTESLSDFMSKCSVSETRTEQGQHTVDYTEEEGNLLATVTEDGDTILHLAIIHELETFTHQLIDLYPKEILDIQNNLYQTPLHLAVYLNQVAVVKALVARSVFIELQDQDGNTPLHVACEHGRFDCANEMIRQVSSSKLIQVFEMQNWRGLTCLHVATLHKHHRIMKLLMKKGVDLNIQEGTSGKTALHMAVELHDVDAVTLLLKRGANVDAAMLNGCTALHLAVGRQDAAITSHLCQAGADKMIRNMDDETALDLADGNDDSKHEPEPLCVCVCVCSVCPVLLLCLCTPVAADIGETLLLEGWQDVWVFRFFLNILGYGTIIIPGYLLIRYLRRINYLETGQGICYPVIKTCVFGNDSKQTLLEDVSETPRIESTSSTRQAIKLIFCAAGLQGSYLTWGVLQERVMTRSYGATEDGKNGERFTDSQFLVFMNRILALTVAGLCCLLFKQPRHTAPMYKYSFASISNILSSWCQYEALKYISFPTQVLAKASKVIPVMLMGKLVSQKSYEYWEYFTAVLISVGVSMFLLSSSSNTKNTITTFSGIIILAGYIMFDSFTSNWQDELFRHKMSSVQMMFGVNLFSCLLTVGSLLETGSLFDSLAFMRRHDEFAAHAALLSLCSAFGQLFIFYTIAQFGAAIFTIIMTLRQAIAILLSCLLYGHTVSATGIFGVVVVFFALFLRVYARNRMKKSSKRAAQAPLQKV